MTVNEILEYMLGWVSDEYDTDVGSFFYDLLYPVAVEAYAIQNKLDITAVNAFALTASGEYLDKKVAEQGITRKAATYAKGKVRITGNRGEVISMGAKVAADSVLFAVDEATTIPEAGYVDVTATCTTPGMAGNVKAGAINRFPVTLPGLTTVVNAAAFTGGYEAESDADLLERYIEKVSRPNVSGNKYQYEEWAKEISGVGSVLVVPLWNGAGTVKVIITDAENQPATAELVAAVQAHIDKNRPVGANATVVSAASKTINISVQLECTNKDTIADTITTVVKKYLAGMAFEKSYVSYAKIGGLILALDDVEDYTSLKVNGGTSNISLGDGVIPIIGTVVVT